MPFKPEVYINNKLPEKNCRKKTKTARNSSLVKWFSIAAACFNYGLLALDSYKCVFSVIVLAREAYC